MTSMEKKVDELIEYLQKNMVTKTEFDEAIEKFRDELNAGLTHVQLELNKHMGAVRKDTDSYANRLKRLEEAVYGVGK